ncbi:MAG: 16S rRNA (guanine(527)-N(7))-methyltransferase RsmG [Microbacter sp.]
MNQLLRYFPLLTKQQEAQFSMFADAFKDWNQKINLISRKDIDHLFEHHILHSLAIDKVLHFKDNSSVLDVGTGGGFPGIPLAILLPNVQFCLIDSIGKKIMAASDMVKTIGLQNVCLKQLRCEEEKGKYDFVVSRAVMPLGDLYKLIRKNISPIQKNALPNGLISLKGGDVNAETAPFSNIVSVYSLSEYFSEPFFTTKKAIYLPVKT